VLDQDAAAEVEPELRRDGRRQFQRQPGSYSRPIRGVPVLANMRDM